MTLLLRRLQIPALALAIAGCAGQSTTTPMPPASTTPATEGEQTDPADAAAGGAPSAELKKVSLTEEQIAEIKKLPEADQTLALEQTVCPSSGEPLGEMGSPIKLEVKGQTVFICCAGCKEDVEEHPDAMLAKLGKKPSEEAPSATP